MATPLPRSEISVALRRYADVRTNAIGEKIITLVDRIATHIGLGDDFYVTSSLRPEPGSHHNGDRSFNGSPTIAADLGFYDDPENNTTDDLQARDLCRALVKYTRPHIVQLIHSTPFPDDTGFYIENGQNVPGSYFGEPNYSANGHINHIHVVYSLASVDAALAGLSAQLGGSTPAPTPPSTGTAIPVGALGLDYAFSRPSIEAMKSANVKYCFRYLSYDNSLTRPKLLTSSEALALNAAGIAVVSNYEWYPERCTEGFAAGAQDARIALAQAKNCGMPDGRPIYFSVDIDTSATAVTGYFQGVASVMPKSQIGVYGSYRVCLGLKNAGLATWFWQTYAWSGGQWMPGRHVEQYLNNQNLGGGSVDFNRSLIGDFGQWLHVSVGGQNQAPGTSGSTPEDDNMINAPIPRWDAPEKGELSITCPWGVPGWGQALVKVSADYASPGGVKLRVVIKSASEGQKAYIVTTGTTSGAGAVDVATVKQVEWVSIKRIPNDDKGFPDQPTPTTDKMAAPASVLVFGS